MKFPFEAELTILDAASDGLGVARLDGQVVFVEHTVPGDVIRARIAKKEKKVLIGYVEEILSPSPDRVAPVCEHAGICGGCKWQMMDYTAQLRYKHKQVVDAVERIAKVPVDEFLPILGSESWFFYRNKLEFTFSAKRWLTRKEFGVVGDDLDQRVTGFHAPGSFDKVLHINACHLQLPIINDIRNAFHAYALEHDLTFHDQGTHEGFLRNLLFRTSVSTGELMVCFIVNDDEEAVVNALFTEMAGRFLEVTDWVWIHNNKWNSSFSDLPVRVWRGKAWITETLGGFQFRISPTSFFQTNPKQAERLYGVVKHMLLRVLAETGQTQFERLYDLYCGTGSIGIYVSDLAKTVAGVDYVESSIRDAEVNASLNGLTHLKFEAGDMKKVLNNGFSARHGKPDMVIVDPARSGMDPAVVEELLRLAPPYIVYVSCKPATQARDIALMANDYAVEIVQPVDMFPHTAHVESVALLKLK